jgi:hypothetical protein
MGPMRSGRLAVGLLLLSVLATSTACRRLRRPGADPGVVDAALPQLDRLADVTTLEPPGPVLCRYDGTIDGGPFGIVLALGLRDHDAFAVANAGKIHLLAGSWGAFADVETEIASLRGVIADLPSLYTTKPVVERGVLYTSPKSRVTVTDRDPGGHVTIAFSATGVSLERFDHPAVACADLSLTPGTFDPAATLGVKSTTEKARLDSSGTVDLRREIGGEVEARLSPLEASPIVSVLERRGNQARIVWSVDDGVATGWVAASALQAPAAPGVVDLSAFARRAGPVGPSRRDPLEVRHPLHAVDADLAGCAPADGAPGTTLGDVTCPRDVRLVMLGEKAFIVGVVPAGRHLKVRARGLAPISFR